MQDKNGSSGAAPIFSFTENFLNWRSPGFQIDIHFLTRLIEINLDIENHAET